jgi:phosphatidate cytidylyltransferase
MAPSPVEASLPAVTAHPLRRRILSALVLAPIALAVVWHGGWIFEAWMVLAGALMAREWGRLTAAGHPGVAGLLLAAGVVAAMAATTIGIAAWQGGLGLIFGACLIYGLARIVGVEAAGWLAIGMLAIGVPCVAFVWLREQPVGGRWAVFWLLGVVWATDIGAYAVGRWLGGPRLAPRVSPNKTWSGLIGGVASAALVGALGAALLGVDVGLPALAGGLLAGVAQAGDLAESLVKRRFGAKDTGSLIPGHGGLLDRVDGLLATTPVVALLMWLKGGSVFGWS